MQQNNGGQQNLQFAFDSNKQMLTSLHWRLATRFFVNNLRLQPCMQFSLSSIDRTIAVNVTTDITLPYLILHTYISLFSFLFFLF